MLRRNGDGVRVEQDAQRRHHRVVVQQRLALAHQHDVRLRLQRCAMIFERHEHLRHNFAHREIAHQSECRRQTEPAIDCAARLRRNANRLAVFFRHENSLDVRRLRTRTCSLKLEDISHRAIRRLVATHHFRQYDRRFACQPLAQRRRQIRHRCEIKSPFGVQRVIKLRAAVARLAERFQPRTQFFRGFSKHVCATVGVFRKHLPLMIARPARRAFRGLLALRVTASS